MGRRAKGEGTLYKTIQKEDRKQYRLKIECETCRNCTNRELCDNRIGTKKCKKCKECTDCLNYCDRFYCHVYHLAQATINGRQQTIATGKKQKEVNRKKTEKLSKIDNGKYVGKNDITFSQQLRYTMQKNLEEEKIGENTYNRNLETIKGIEKKNPEITSKKLQKVTRDDILEILRSNKKNSQSVIEKAYDIINVSLKKAVKDKLIEEDNNPIEDIERTSILSEKDKKIAIPFTVEETQRIIKYIDEHAENLVDIIAKIDSISMKNLIKLSFAFGTRCGELSSINIDKHIDFDAKKIIIERTLTRNKKKQVIIGKNTKTGKKAKKRGKKDSREILFFFFYSKYEIEEI